MKTISALRWLVTWGLGTALGCSAGGDQGSGLVPGDDGGSSAQGGTSGNVGVGGSSSGSTGKGGSAMIDIGGSSGASAGSAGSPPSCNHLDVTSTLIVPTVLLLVDNSSSMFEENGSPVTAWSLLYDALMDPQDGVIPPLQDQIRFGFSSYKGHQASSEDDPACATMTPATPTYALQNYDAMNTVYEMLGSETNNGSKWETPTGHAIMSVLPSLTAFTADPPGPKYILLVTDGNPNTCETIDPQCGQDRTIAAVQTAYSQGVGTFVIGIGDIVTAPDNGCNSGQARCGSDHLQDVANAGVGLPVMAPPTDYKYQPCVQNETGDVTATYTAGEVAENADYFATNDPTTLKTKLSQLLLGVASCTFDLDAIVTGDPTRSNVTLDGVALAYGDTAGGWMLEENKYQVTLQGTACDTYRSTAQTGMKHNVLIEFWCDEQGNPVAEPR